MDRTALQQLDSIFKLYHWSINVQASERSEILGILLSHRGVLRLFRGMTQRWTALELTAQEHWTALPALETASGLRRQLGWQTRRASRLR